MNSFTFRCPRCGYGDPRTNCVVCAGKGTVTIGGSIAIRSRPGTTWFFELPPGDDYEVAEWGCIYHKNGCHNLLDCVMVPLWRKKSGAPAAHPSDKDVDGYIEEIAQLRRDLHSLQGRYRAEIAENGASKVLIQDLQSEIARHHKDFLRISKLAEQAAAFSDVNPERIKLIRTIRNIVG